VTSENVVPSHVVVSSSHSSVETGRFVVIGGTGIVSHSEHSGVEDGFVVTG